MTVPGDHPRVAVGGGNSTSESKDIYLPNTARQSHALDTTWSATLERGARARTVSPVRTSTATTATVVQATPSVTHQPQQQTQTHVQPQTPLPLQAPHAMTPKAAVTPPMWVHQRSPQHGAMTPQPQVLSRGRTDAAQRDASPLLPLSQSVARSLTATECHQTFTPGQQVTATKGAHILRVYPPFALTTGQQQLQQRS